MIWSNSGTISGSDPTINYSIVESGYVGIGNVDDDPSFKDGSNPLGDDGVWLTPDDGLRLLSGGVAGNTAQPSTAADFDVLGQSRPLDGSPDMGAYEGRLPVVTMGSTASSIGEASGTTNIPVAVMPGDYGLTLYYSTTGDIVTSGSISISAGSIGGDISIPIPDDNADEFDKDVTITLDSVTVSGDGSAVIHSPSTHILTINDDDAPPTVQFDFIIVSFC